MKTDLEVIDGAIELVEADGGWCQGALCRNSDGNAVQPSPESPTGWKTVVSQASVSRTSWEILSFHDRFSAPPVTFCLEGAIRMSAGLFAIQKKQKRHLPGVWKLGLSRIWEQCFRLEELVLQAANQNVLPGYGKLSHLNDSQRTSKEEAVLALKTTRSRLETSKENDENRS